MKVRLGFVSNSSSSSFAILYNDINLKDVKVEDLKKKRIMVDTGKCYEGTVYAEIKTKGLLDFYKDKKVKAYEVYHEASDWGTRTIGKSSLPKTFKMLAANADQNTVTTLQEAEDAEKYGDY